MNMVFSSSPTRSKIAVSLRALTRSRSMVFFSQARIHEMGCSSFLTHSPLLVCFSCMIRIMNQVCFCVLTRLHGMGVFPFFNSLFLSGFLTGYESLQQGCPTCPSGQSALFLAAGVLPPPSCA